MALPKLFQRIFWYNNTTPAINEDNLNAMSKAIDDLDNRVIVLGDDVITVIPQIQAYLEQAEDLVEAMEMLSQNPPYIGQNGNWWVWDTNTSAFVDSGVDASISVNIEDITMLAPDAAPYVTNTGTATDPIFHLFIPRGQTGNGISTIAKTGTSGLVDTYTITMTDGTTSTFTVTNGAGDMNKSVYDPTNAIANAGGMKSAATKNSTNAVTENSTDLVESGAVYTANKGIYEVMGQNGAKNLLPNNATTQTINGVTFTVNADKTITANGTATAYVELTLHDYMDAGGLKQNSYKITGCPNGGSEQTYQIFARSGSDHQTIYHDYGAGGVINDSLDWIKLNIKNGQTVSNLVFKPMIRLASDTDSTYQPYAETNQQLTANKVSWDDYSEVSAVNFLKFNPTTETKKGYTFTNDNGVVHVTGSRTSGETGNVDFNKRISLKAGTYRLTGCPSGGSNDTWRLLLNINNSEKYVFDYGDGAEFTLDADSENVMVYCTIMSAYSGTVDFYFKPMIAPVSYNGDYVPYAMTNRELTDSISDISTIRNNAANAYSGILKLAEHDIGDNANVTIPNMKGVWLAIMSRTHASSCGVYLLVIHSNGTSKAILPIAPVENTDFSISVSGTSVVVQTGTATSGRIRFLRITDSNY